MVTVSPISIVGGGPYTLNFILIDTDMVPEFPRYFSELLGEPGPGVAGQLYDLTGSWTLYEEYDFGSTMTEAYLVQSGSMLSGLMMISDTMDDGEELLIQQSVSGKVEGNSFCMNGTNVRVLKGRSSDYVLDRWQGNIESNDRISGYSQDLAGTSGVFLMERMLD